MCDQCANDPKWVASMERRRPLMIDASDAVVLRDAVAQYLHTVAALAASTIGHSMEDGARSVANETGQRLVEQLAALGKMIDTARSEGAAAHGAEAPAPRNDAEAVERFLDGLKLDGGAP